MWEKHEERSDIESMNSNCQSQNLGKPELPQSQNTLLRRVIQ